MLDAAAQLIEALKAQPAVLALTVANLALLAFLYFGLAGAAANRDMLVKQVIDNGASIRELLRDRSAPCAPTP